MAFELFVDGIDFAEGPRWHASRLWYSDFYQHTVFAVSESGERTRMLTIDDQPSGLGWLPNGDLLVVSMQQRRLLRFDGSRTSVHADLSALVDHKCNDMVVSSTGHAYVGNFGFDLENREKPKPTRLIHVRPDGAASVCEGDLHFPNGSVITPDGRTLIVGETFGARYSAFDIAEDGTLSGHRMWAEIPGTFPDGCALDQQGAIWFADAVGTQLVRVTAGGEVTHRLPTPAPTFACMLGGEDGRTLYALTAPGSHPDEASGKAGGAIYATGVDIAHAGLP